MIKPNAVMLRLMSMESIDETVETPVVVTDSEQLKDDIETGELEGAFDGLVQVIENLKRIRESISGSLAEGGLSHGAAEGYISAVSAAVEPVSLDGSLIMLTHECFDKDDIRLRATELSMESIGKTIGNAVKKAWEIFVNLFKRIVTAIRKRLTNTIEITEDLPTLITQVKAIDKPTVTCKVKGKASLLVNDFGKVLLDDADKLCGAAGYLVYFAMYANTYLNVIVSGKDQDSWKERAHRRPVSPPNKINTTFFTSEPGEYYPRGITLIVPDTQPQDVGVNIKALSTLLTAIDKEHRPDLIKLNESELVKLVIPEDNPSIPPEALVYPREALVYLNGMSGVISEVMGAVISLAKQVVGAHKAE